MKYSAQTFLIIRVDFGCGREVFHPLEGPAGVDNHAQAKTLSSFGNDWVQGAAPATPNNLGGIHRISLAAHGPENIVDIIDVDIVVHLEVPICAPGALQLAYCIDFPNPFPNVFVAHIRSFHHPAIDRFIVPARCRYKNGSKPASSLHGRNKIGKTSRFREPAMTRSVCVFMIVPLLCFAAVKGFAVERVIVGHSATAALSIGPLLYGIERGFYRDEGIDLVYVSLRADLGIKALLAGDLDYSYSVGTIIRGAVLGVPVKNLTFDFSRVLHALMSRPEIPSAAALKGRIVGVSSFGATGDLAARVGLRSLGLDPDKDVTIITLGSDTLRHAALQAGTVQATHMPVPLNIQLKKQGYHELVYAGRILQRPLTGLATSVEKIQKNPGQVQRMVRAFVRATRALRNERAGFIAFAQKKYGYPKEVMEEAYKYLVEALAQDGFVDDSVLQAAIDEARNVTKVTKAISPSDVVDYSFLRTAVKK